MRAALCSPFFSFGHGVKNITRGPDWQYQYFELASFLYSFRFLNVLANF